AGAVGDEVMERYRAFNADLRVARNDLGHGGGIVELILDPFEAIDRGARVAGGIARAVRPHQLDGEPRLVQAAHGLVPDELVEAHAAEPGDPARRVPGRVTVGEAGDAALVDDEHAVVEAEVVVLAHDDPLVGPEAQGGAGGCRPAVKREPAGDQKEQAPHGHILTRTAGAAQAEVELAAFPWPRIIGSAPARRPSSRRGTRMRACRPSR